MLAKGRWCFFSPNIGAEKKMTRDIRLELTDALTPPDLADGTEFTGPISRDGKLVWLAFTKSECGERRGMRE